MNSRRPWLLHELSGRGQELGYRGRRGRRNTGHPKGPEDGFGLIELIISIVVLTTVLVSGAQLVAGVAFAASDQRARVAASNLATQEIEKIRQGASAPNGNFFGTTPPAGNISYDSFDPGSHPAVPQTVNAVPFTILDQEQLGASGSSGSSCTNGNASQSEILHVDVKVTWTIRLMSHTVEQFTNIAPPSSVNNPTLGNVGVLVLSALGQPVPGLAASLFDPSRFVTTDATTASDGCAFFADLSPTDSNNQTISYRLSVGPGSNYISNLEAPKSTTTVTVAAGKTTEVNQSFDLAATLSISGVSYPAGTPTPLPAPVSPLSVSVANSVIPAGYAVFAPNPTTPTSLTPLFPFQNGYVVFAGGCADNDPNGLDTNKVAIYPGAVAATLATVTANTVTSTGLNLVPLTVQVLNSDGSPATGAIVTVTYQPTSTYACVGAPLQANFPSPIGASPATETAGISYGKWTVNANLNGHVASVGVWAQPAQPNANPATSAGIYPITGGSTPMASPVVMRLS